jgi:hypothetical protein
MTIVAALVALIAALIAGWIVARRQGLIPAVAAGVGVTVLAAAAYIVLLSISLPM